MSGDFVKLCASDETASLAVAWMHFLFASIRFKNESGTGTHAYQWIRKKLSLISRNGTDFCNSTSHNEFSLPTELVFEVRQVKIMFAIMNPAKSVISWWITWSLPIQRPIRCSLLFKSIKILPVGASELFFAPLIWFLLIFPAFKMKIISNLINKADQINTDSVKQLFTHRLCSALSEWWQN